MIEIDLVEVYPCCSVQVINSTLGTEKADEGCGGHVLLQLVRHGAPSGLDLSNQILPLHDLLHHELHRHIKHVALRPALPFQAGHNGSDSIKTITYCLASFLFCCREPMLCQQVGNEGGGDVLWP